MVAVSVAALFIRLAAAPPLVIAAYRMGLAFLFQAPFVWPAARAELADPQRRRSVGIAILAGLALAVHFAAWVTSLKLTSVAASTVIVTTQPVWVALGSYLFFHERLPAFRVAALLLALLGTALIGWGDAGSPGAALPPDSAALAALPTNSAALPLASTALAGDALALLGAICMAVYLMAGQRAQRLLGPGTYTFIAYGVAATALLAMALLRGDSLYPYPLSDWAAFLGLAVICTLGGHSLLNRALRHLPATAVSAAILGEPVGATLWAFLFLGEAPRGIQLYGGLLTLAGLLLFNRGVSSP